MNKSFLEIQIEEAEKDYKLAIEQYVRASEQLRSNLDQAQALAKELIRDRYRKESSEAQAKLEKLKAERGGTTSISFSSSKGSRNLLRQALLIGVDRYQHYPDLDACANEAEDVSRALAKGGYSGKNIELVSDHEGRKVDRNLIEAALLKAIAVEESDLFLFYFSGHGDTAGDESYLVMPGSNSEDLPETGIPLKRLRELIESSSARSKVIIIDSCHSGASFATKGKPERAISIRYLEHLYTRAKGWAVMASCEQGQLSYIWLERRRSVFTHFLLEALEGHADYQNLGFVSVQHTYSYMQPRVTEWVRQEHGRDQIPTLSLETAGDIVIAYLNQ